MLANSHFQNCLQVCGYMFGVGCVFFNNPFLCAQPNSHDIQASFKALWAVGSLGETALLSGWAHAGCWTMEDKSMSQPKKPATCTAAVVMDYGGPMHLHHSSFFVHFLALSNSLSILSYLRRTGHCGHAASRYLGLSPEFLPKDHLDHCGLP